MLLNDLMLSVGLDIGVTGNIFLKIRRRDLCRDPSILVRREGDRVFFEVTRYGFLHPTGRPDCLPVGG
jgi:hypothetical protein